MSKLDIVSATTLVKRLRSALIPTWLQRYDTSCLGADVVAGIVVGILVIPQSLGYAVLAGMPPVYGLYAAIVPVIVYAFIGSSNVQAVGPVAITAIMTASGLQKFADQGSTQYILMASLLSLMVGIMLWLAGRLKLGWIMQFISRGVAAGFISGAAVLIFVSQLKYITGAGVSGSTLLQYVGSLASNMDEINQTTLMVGLVSFALFAINRYGSRWLWHSWLSDSVTKWVARLFPLLVVLVAIVASRVGDWSSLGVLIIGDVPTGLPKLTLPYLPDIHQGLQLIPTAALIALIAFVSSSSVASTYARQRGEDFDANKELNGLGLANIAGGFFQSFPIAGGFSRTAINVDSGATSPLASMVTVFIMVATLLVLGDVIKPLPYALLGAMIMASIISLIDVATLKSAWRTDRLDALSFSTAFIGVLIFGLNIGLVIGIITSFAGLIWQSSQPHIAVTGRLAGTEHFRNINRHDVITHSNILIMRVDESLFFGNSQSVHEQIHSALHKFPEAKDLVLIMSAVNHIDLTAQEMLLTLNRELIANNKRLHYSYIKGPVMDVIADTPIIKELSGRVFLSTMQAVTLLTDDDPTNDVHPTIQTKQAGATIPEQTIDEHSKGDAH